MRAKVLQISKREDLPWWHILKLDSHPKEVLLNQNWYNANGEVKAGDKVEFEVEKVPVYNSAPEYDFVRGFRRVPEEEVSADA